MWEPYADTYLFNGKIYTVDTTIEKIKACDYDFPIFENGYIAIKDGKIIETGEGENTGLVGPKTDVIDLAGKIVIPGLVDSHMHATFAGEDLAKVNCSKMTCLDEMLKAIEKKALETPEGEWVTATAFNELAWDDGKMPDLKTLDSVSHGHPVVAKRLCGHVLVGNSIAFELAGINKDTVVADGGTIDYYEDGTPNGWLHERAAISLLEAVIPEVTEDELLDGIVDMGKYMNSVGLTTVIDCNLDPVRNRNYSKAYKLGKLTYRANLTYFISREIGDLKSQLEKFDTTMVESAFGNGMINLHAIKILLDGTPAAGTAYMRKNYMHMPETRGFTTFTQEEMNEICTYAAKNHWQMAVHAIGDAAMDVALEAFETACSAYDNRDNRNYIIHAVFPREDMLPKIKDLGVAVTVQPTIMGCMGEEAVLTEEDAALNQPAGLYFDNGIVCGGGTDCPVVDCNPFIGMSKAMTRIALDGKVHGEAYRVSAAQALIMWTMSSAYITCQEDKIGSIAAGKEADLVIIDTPILEASADEVEHTKVLETYLGGKLVYEA